MNENSLNIGVIDLSTKNVEVKRVSFDDERMARYLGVEGLVLEYLLETLPANLDPLAPENALCFMTGLFSGSNTPFSGRYFVGGKSPLTETYGEANSGGSFGPELRKAGYDALIITGKAPSLSMITIIDGSIEILAATEYQGLDCVELEQKLKERFDKRAQIASIGEAGENQVLITGIVTEKGRIAARAGLGALMGAKNLKCVVTRGKEKIPVAHPEDFKAEWKKLGEILNPKVGKIGKMTLKMTPKLSPWFRRFKIKNFAALGPNSLVVENYKKYGTCMGTAISVSTGDAAIKNYKGSYKDFPLKKSQKITGENVVSHQIKNYGCRNCPVACGGILGYKDEKYDLPETDKPEYETLVMLGSNLLIDDLGALLATNDYCNRQGIDTIGLGALFGFIFEAVETGILPTEKLNGLPIDWGNGDVLVPLAKMITKREGMGDVLAQGVGKAAAALGEDAKPLAMHISNQGIPAHDPRFMNSLVATYKLDPCPGRHTPFTESWIDISRFRDQYPELAEENEWADYYMYHQAYASLGMCSFGMIVGKFPVLPFLKAVTGFDLDVNEFIDAGKRIFALKTLFNLKQGVRSMEFKLPERLLEPSEEGPHHKANLQAEEEEILKKFLNSLNWNETTGLPTAEELQRLGLHQFTELLP